MVFAIFRCILQNWVAMIVAIALILCTAQIAGAQNTASGSLNPSTTDKLIPAPDAEWYQNIVQMGTVGGGYSHGQFLIVDQITHAGIDIGGGCRQKVYAAQDGEVVKVVKNGDVDFGVPGKSGVGNAVVIRHPDEGNKPVYTLYLHMAETPLVSPGPIERGDKMGLTGKTGFARGCHLHFEVRHFAGIRDIYNDDWKNIYGKGDKRKDPIFLNLWSDPENWVGNLKSTHEGESAPIDEVTIVGSSEPENTEPSDLRAFCTAHRNYPGPGENGSANPDVVASGGNTWRCMDGMVLVCYLGASGRACLQTSNLDVNTRTAIKNYCVKSPNNHFVPMYLIAGLASTWRCSGAEPVQESTIPTDKLGYFVEAWHILKAPDSLAKQAPIAAKNNAPNTLIIGNLADYLEKGGTSAITNLHLGVRLVFVPSQISFVSGKIVMSNFSVPTSAKQAVDNLNQSFSWQGWFDVTQGNNPISKSIRITCQFNPDDPGLEKTTFSMVNATLLQYSAKTAIFACSIL